MASEQAGVRKKQSRNPDKDELRNPVLYRHQDCIPNPKLLQNCEKHNRPLLKINQNVECHGKLTKDQESISSKSKTKLVNSKGKSDNKADKGLPETKVNSQQPVSGVGNNEELSKARRRRLRKRRLLVSLAPPPNTNITPDPPAENIPHQINPASRPIPRTSGGATSSSTSSASKQSDQLRPSIKDFRKRLDKSGSRNKNLKSKTLIDPTTQTKADIIKSLEEKTLNSLLQTLVPLANVSPKKEKPLPHFSFPEKRLNSSDTKVDKDGVFYFGETKHQLEKLNSEFKTNTSLIQEKSDFAQNTGFNTNCFSLSKPVIKFEKYPSFNFSSLSNDKPDNFPPAKQNLFIAETASQTTRIENKRVFPCDCQIKDHVFKSPVLKDFSQFPTQVLNSINPPLSAPLTSFTNTSTFGESKIKETSDTSSNHTENNIQMSYDLITSILEAESKYCVTNSIESESHCCDIKNSLDRYITDCQTSSISSPEGVGNSSENKSFIGVTSNSEESSINNSSLASVQHSNQISETKIISSNNSLLHSNQNSQMMEELQNNLIVQKPAGDTNKSNKTREEIMLEREARKAAKLASKTKHKIGQTNKVEVSNAPIKLENAVDVDNKKKENAEDKVCKVEVLHDKCTEAKPHTNIVPSGNKTVSESNKESTVDRPILGSAKKPGSESSVKSKSELKAERRAKQEAQRAAKVLNKTDQASQPKVKEKKPSMTTEQRKANLSTGPTEKKQEIVKVSSQPKPKLFGHLHQLNSSLTSDLILKAGGFHPAVVSLGIQYSSRVVVGSNARCVALLHVLKKVISDYTTPPAKDFSRGLEEELKPITDFLNKCRPLSVSMINALRHVKRTLTQFPNNISDVDARQKLRAVINTYIQDQIDKAKEAICYSVHKKIDNGDVILTYGCSSLVYKILVESHQSGTKFQVVVVDGLPWTEGREMLRRLVNKGLSCSYALITATSFIMRKVDKVLLGAHALLANGYVMSRAGSSQVALLANSYNIPVLVCCETHKFCEKVQTDAFLFNELVSEEVSNDSIKDKERRRPTPLSLAFDITPPDFVTAVVTELAILPCTSVPVVLRVKPADC